MTADDPSRILARWLPRPQEATVRPLATTSGFSGARLWQVHWRGESLLLRQWPASAGPLERIQGILKFQGRLADASLPVGRPRPTLGSGDLGAALGVDGAWSLTDWMLGVADYWSSPRDEKLRAAMRTLAQAHLAESTLKESAGGPHTRLDRSPALVRRWQRLQELQAGEVAALRQAVQRPSLSATHAETGRAALELIAAALPRQHRIAAAWADRPLPLQWRLGDVWHDHVLFTGDEVSGLIDFGAASVDSPAGDVARLLGSMVGDDKRCWRLGLEAYESVRPLASDEQEAVRVFDTTGTVLSAANWVHWLYGGVGQLPAGTDREAGQRRLLRLISRLQRLAAEP